MDRRKVENGFGQKFRSLKRRRSRHDSAGAAEGAGVVADVIGVGLPDAHARRGGAECGRRDLGVDGGGAVAELGGADG